MKSTQIVIWKQSVEIEKIPSLSGQGAFILWNDLNANQKTITIENQETLWKYEKVSIKIGS